MKQCAAAPCWKHTQAPASKCQFSLACQSCSTLLPASHVLEAALLRALKAGQRGARCGPWRTRAHLHRAAEARQRQQSFRVLGLCADL